MKWSVLAGVLVAVASACSAVSPRNEASAATGGASTASSTEGTGTATGTETVTIGSSSSSGGGGASGNFLACEPTTDVTYSGPGPDGVYGTADDPITGRMAITYQANGWLDTVMSYDTAGLDGVWGTADDHLATKTLCTGDPATHSNACTYVSVGPDGIWNTPDDSAYSYTKYHYDASDKLVLDESEVYPGNDGVLMTADDVISTFAVLTWQGNRCVSQRDSSGAGADGIWGTADDDWQSGVQYLYGPSGLLLAVVTSTSPGPDGIWATPDDPVEGALETTCSNGDTLTILSATGPGPDGVWGTSDDVLSPARAVMSGQGCGMSCVPPFT